MVEIVSRGRAAGGGPATCLWTLARRSLHRFVVGQHRANLFYRDTSVDDPPPTFSVAIVPPVHCCIVTIPQGPFRHFIGARADAVMIADLGATEGGT